MTKSMQSFQITPKVIDFGARIVALAHVTSVQNRKCRPFLPAGIALLVASGVLIGWELIQAGSLTALAKTGSTRLWFAFVGAGLGIFAQVYQRRGLEIRLADGSRIDIPSNRDDFLQSVVTRIGEAMRAPDTDLHYAVDVKAQTIQIHSAAETATSQVTDKFARPLDLWPMPQVANTWPVPAAALPHDAAPHNLPLRAGRSQTDLIPGEFGHAELNGAAAPAASGRVSDSASKDARASRFEARPLPHTAPTAQPATQPVRNGNGASYGANGHAPAMANGAAHGRAAGQPAQPVMRDLDVLIDFVRRTELQHKDALLNLLTVVDDYAKGGATHQTDAIEHWQSFLSYVHQYLGDVDGLLPLTDRAGRRFEWR